MQNRKLLFLILSMAVVLVLAVTVKAGISDNVSGMAWHSLMGWISFNNTSGGGGNSYGVDIADNGTTGIFSGYAWSSGFGWIDFNEAHLAGCPSGTCRAWVDKITGQVSGWAKILTTNDWLHLRGSNYGILISKITGDFSGWAWGGETAGWVSFNCNQTETGNHCPTANYKVNTSFDMNIKPTITIAGVPAFINECSNPAYNLSWVFSDLDPGDTQRQYQLQIDSDGNWNNNASVPGEVDIIAASSALSKEILLAKNPLAGSNQLLYNKLYSWRVKVWDNHSSSVNSESAWSGVGTFTTPTHIWPSPYFDWSPKPIIKDQQIQFSSDASKCYSDLNVETSCAGKTFVWTITNGAIVGGTSANPIVKFDTSGNQPVSLRITDNIGVCSTSTNVRVTLPLPKWKEILPQ